MFTPCANFSFGDSFISITSLGVKFSGLLTPVTVVIIMRYLKNNGVLYVVMDCDSNEYSRHTLAEVVDVENRKD